MKRAFNKRTKDKNKIVEEDIESDSDGGGDKSQAPVQTNWDEEVKRATVSSSAEHTSQFKS